MPEAELGPFIRRFIQRVVNEHDVSGVDDMVSPDYRGSGSEWQHLAPDFKTLREFYQRQAAQRPDWRIDIQETIELGEYVVARVCPRHRGIRRQRRSTTTTVPHRRGMVGRLSRR